MSTKTVSEALPSSDSPKTGQVSAPKSRPRRKPAVAGKPKGKKRVKKAPKREVMPLIACPVSARYLKKLDRALRKKGIVSTTGKPNRSKFVKQACDRLIASVK